MSRSRHTDPPHVRAPRRVLAPHAPRAVATAWRRAAAVSTAYPLPRVAVVRPPNGYLYPVTVADVRRVLRRLGPEATYGLRRIALVPQPPPGRGGALRLGALRLPGTVLLFALPDRPWKLPGHLPVHVVARLGAAGARIATAGPHTVIEWPGVTLRDFVLRDVLLHEIGHHHLQQYAWSGGARLRRAARTAAHEAYACRYALRHSRGPAAAATAAGGAHLSA